MAQTPFDRGTVGRDVWGAGIVENVKWMIRRWGVLFIMLLAVIIASTIILKQSRQKEADVLMEDREHLTEAPVNSHEVKSIEDVAGKSADDSLDSSDVFQKSEKCLITEDEKRQLQEQALAAAEQVKEVYRDIEVIGSSSFASNIVDFTGEQCKEVVALFGQAGFVSITEDCNMVNPEKIQSFYSDYLEKRDSMFTIYEVNPDGLIGAFTFIYRDDRLQTYYVGIGWQQGGTPEIRSTLVNNIAEMKLTEKGYFIYSYEILIPHSSLRQYWRIMPISDQCRELTEKYISRLSYVNYNMLVTNWDSSNVGDILMPCMFEDIYRIYTGEILKAENQVIPAELYEQIMTTYFPVSVEKVRELCGYDEGSGTYPYKMIYSRPYPPFGEVVDYAENNDGTITLYIDGVWPDYNSDYAFTNIVVVQPFEDGTFRYLSNAIEKRELEIPIITGTEG